MDNKMSQQNQENELQKDDQQASVLSSKSDLNIEDFMSENKSPEEIIKGSILSVTEVLGDLQAAAINAETRMMTHEDSTEKMASILQSFGDQIAAIKSFVGMTESGQQSEQEPQAMGQIAPTQPMGQPSQQGQLSPDDARTMLANIAQASQQQ